MSLHSTRRSCLGTIATVAAFTIVAACGGSVSTGEGGSSGAGATAGNGGTSGVGGSAAKGGAGGTSQGGYAGWTGGTGGAPMGGSAGTGGCVDTGCGPDYANCCNPGMSCGNWDGTQCGCGSDMHWHCYGVGGSPQGGAAGSGGCIGTPCGPDMNPCCTPGIACASSSGTCSCANDWLWHCNGSGGSGGSCVDYGCGPTGMKCCYPGSGCATPGPNGSCNCGGDYTWHCSGGYGGMAGAGGSPACDPSNCAPPFTCCGQDCVNPLNDPSHCGSCNGVCASPPGSSPYCDYGKCTIPPCWGSICDANSFCCGQTCCKMGQMCCDVQGPGPSSGPICHTPTAMEPTCPMGCPLCQ